MDASMDRKWANGESKNQSVFQRAHPSTANEVDRLKPSLTCLRLPTKRRKTDSDCVNEQLLYILFLVFAGNTVIQLVLIATSKCVVHANATKKIASSPEYLLQL